MSKQCSDHTKIGYFFPNQINISLPINSIKHSISNKYSTYFIAKTVQDRVFQGLVCKIAFLNHYQVQKRTHRRRDQISPLMAASSCGLTDLVSWFVKLGKSTFWSSTYTVDINKRDSKGLTAVFYAAKHNHPEIVSVLLQSMASPLLENNRGLNALAFAKACNIKGSHDKVIKILETTKKKSK